MEHRAGGKRPFSLLSHEISLCSDNPKAGWLGSTGRDCGLGTISAAFMMGSDSTDAFQVVLQEADLVEPVQKRKDQVGLCGYSSRFVSTNDTSCWGRPEIAAGH